MHENKWEDKLWETKTQNNPSLTSTPNKLNGVIDRWKAFYPACRKVGPKLEQCKTTFQDWEKSRILDDVQQETNIAGMQDRWNLIRKECKEMGAHSDACLDDFWNLEKNRYLKGVEWENNIAGKSLRWREFQPLCEKDIKNLTSRNMDQCRLIFDKLEQERVSKGLKWEENWKSRWEGVQERWKDFNASCSKINPKTVSCNEVFWDKLEHNLYAHGTKWENKLDNLEKTWKEFQSNPDIPEEDRERIFWYHMFRESNEKDEPCARIHADIYRSLSLAERVGNPNLVPTCPEHAKVILGLKEDGTVTDCQTKSHNVLSSLHPDKQKGKLGLNESTVNDLYNKAVLARDTLCPRG